MSRAVFNDLVGLNYIPMPAYADYQVEGVTLFIFMTQNALLTFLACYVMLDIGDQQSRAGSVAPPLDRAAGR